MGMIVLDLEWNTVFYNDAQGERRHFDEIIQIGAVRLADGYQPADTFNCYVRNAQGPLNPSIAELVKVDEETLAASDDFPTVAAAFLDWCGENPRFLTWSNSDIPVLRQNFLFYDLNASAIKRAYNVQFAYSMLISGSTSAVALNKAVDACNLELDEQFHSAVGDAVYTARIMSKLWQEYGAKTRESYLYGQLQKLRAAKHPPRASKAPSLAVPDSFEDWLEAPSKYSRSAQHKTLACNTHRKAYFRQSGNKTFLCPKCRKKMAVARWLMIEENRYVNLAVCADHGKFYALMRLRRKNPYLWEGVVDLYPERECGLLAQWMRFHS